MQTALTQFFVVVLAVASMLEATAVYNTAGFGIPLWWLCGFLAFFVLALRSARGFEVRVGKDVLLFAGCMFALLCLPTVFHIVSLRADPDVALRQILGRSALVMLFLVGAVGLSVPGSFDATAKALKIFFVVYIGYGLFDYWAMIVGLPGYLEFITNSASFEAPRIREPKGWVAWYRTKAFSFEPSLTTLPVCFALYLGFFVWKSTPTTRVLIALTYVFSVLTFARSQWGTVLAATLTLITSRVLLSLQREISTKLLNLGLAVMVVVLPWAMIALRGSPLGFGDASAHDRGETTMLGLRVFAEHPLVGVGLNSLRDVSDIHNGLASHMQALGVWGVLFYYLPLVYIALLRLPIEARLWWIAVLAVFGNTTDILYPSHAWFILAFLTAQAASGLRERRPDAGPAFSMNRAA